MSAPVADFAYPKPWPLFWAAAVLALGYTAVGIARIWRGRSRGLPTPPPAHPAPGRALRLGLVEVFLQPQLRRVSPVRWLAHLGIFWGFLALCLLSVTHVALAVAGRLGIDGGLAAWALHGDGRAALKAWGHVFGVVLLAGLVLALARRALPRTGAADREPESDAPAVVFLLALTLSGFLLEWLRAAAGASPAAAASLAPWLTALWTVHGLGGLAFVAWLPRGTLTHTLLAPLVIAENARHEHARKDLAWPKPRKTATGSPRD